jgi:DNA processing protein
VASGGALGIDRAVHEGALEAGGTTWLFAPCGIEFEKPDKNKDLYERIKESETSNIISVFADDVTGCERAYYFQRNAAMAAMAGDVVCIQAGLKSGARNTMKYGRELGRRRWVVPPHPFLGRERMRGCEAEVELGAHALPFHVERFVAHLLGKVPLLEVPAELVRTAPLEEPSRPLGEMEERVLSVLTAEPRHTDEIAHDVGLSAPNVATALLTLALEDVVVEGPGGFFRRN